MGRALAVAVAVAILAACGGGGSQTFEPVALHNMDFESPLADGAAPADWAGSGDGYEFGVDAEVVRSGTGSGRIRKVGTSTAFGTMTRCVPSPPGGDRTVRLSGLLRTQDVAGGWAGLWLRVDGPSVGERPALLAFDNMQDSGVGGTTEWSSYSIVLPLAGTAVAMCFGFLLTGSGTAWADDLELAVTA